MQLSLAPLWGIRHVSTTRNQRAMRVFYENIKPAETRLTWLIGPVPTSFGLGVGRLPSHLLATFVRKTVSENNFSPEKLRC